MDDLMISLKKNFSGVEQYLSIIREFFAVIVKQLFVMRTN